MATLTIQIPDKEKDLFLQILKKFNAKVLTSSETGDINSDLVEALKEAKLINEKKLQGLSLEDMR